MAKTVKEISWETQEEEEDQFHSPASKMQYTPAHTSTKSSTLRTCVTIATTEKVNPKWQQNASTSIDLTTLTDCAKTAT